MIVRVALSDRNGVYSSEMWGHAGDHHWMIQNNLFFRHPKADETICVPLQHIDQWAVDLLNSLDP